MRPRGEVIFGKQDFHLSFSSRRSRSKLELPFQFGQERGDFSRLLVPGRPVSMARAAALKARPPTLAAAPLMACA